MANTQKNIVHLSAYSTNSIYELKTLKKLTVLYAQSSSEDTPATGSDIMPNYDSESGIFSFRTSNDFSPYYKDIELYKYTSVVEQAISDRLIQSAQVEVNCVLTAVSPFGDEKLPSNVLVGTFTPSNISTVIFARTADFSSYMEFNMGEVNGITKVFPDYPNNIIYVYFFTNSGLTTHDITISYKYIQNQIILDPDYFVHVYMDGIKAGRNLFRLSYFSTKSGINDKFKITTFAGQLNSIANKSLDLADQTEYNFSFHSAPIFYNKNHIFFKTIYKYPKLYSVMLLQNDIQRFPTYILPLHNSSQLKLQNKITIKHDVAFQGQINMLLDIDFDIDSIIATNFETGKKHNLEWDVINKFIKFGNVIPYGYYELTIIVSLPTSIGKPIEYDGITDMSLYNSSMFITNNLYISYYSASDEYRISNKYSNSDIASITSRIDKYILPELIDTRKILPIYDHDVIGNKPLWDQLSPVGLREYLYINGANEDNYKANKFENDTKDLTSVYDYINDRLPAFKRVEVLKKTEAKDFIVVTRYDTTDKLIRITFRFETTSSSLIYIRPDPRYVSGIRKALLNKHLIFDPIIQNPFNEQGELYTKLTEFSLIYSPLLLDIYDGEDLDVFKIPFIVGLINERYGIKVIELNVMFDLDFTGWSSGTYSSGEFGKQ